MIYRTDGNTLRILDPTDESEIHAIQKSGPDGPAIIRALADEFRSCDAVTAVVEEHKTKGRCLHFVDNNGARVIHSAIMERAEEIATRFNDARQDEE